MPEGILYFYKWWRHPRIAEYKNAKRVADRAGEQLKWLRERLGGVPLELSLVCLDRRPLGLESEKIFSLDWRSGMGLWEFVPNESTSTDVQDCLKRVITGLRERPFPRCSQMTDADSDFE